MSEKAAHALVAGGVQGVGVGNGALGLWVMGRVIWEARTKPPTTVSTRVPWVGVIPPTGEGGWVGNKVRKFNKGWESGKGCIPTWGGVGEGGCQYTRSGKAPPRRGCWPCCMAKPTVHQHAIIPTLSVNQCPAVSHRYSNQFGPFLS